MKKPVITNDGIRQLKCFDKVSAVIGDELAIVELRKVLLCDCDFEDKFSISLAFLWEDAPQRIRFWADIAIGVNPYEN